uniref:Uncharacterized protein n=1 Tax=Oryza nivara TaxID=4536 RepID=A0A0E0IXG4_ORYNI
MRHAPCEPPRHRHCPLLVAVVAHRLLHHARRNGAVILDLSFLCRLSRTARRQPSVVSPPAHRPSALGALQFMTAVEEITRGRATPVLAPAWGRDAIPCLPSAAVDPLPAPTELRLQYLTVDISPPLPPCSPAPASSPPPCRWPPDLLSHLAPSISSPPVDRRRWATQSHQREEREREGEGREEGKEIEADWTG